MFIKTRLLFVFLCLTLLIFGLAGCTGAPLSSLRIEDVTISPDPVVGQWATVSVQVKSGLDEPDVEFSKVLGPLDTLTSDFEVIWTGKIEENGEQTIQFPICITHEGKWGLVVNIRASSGMGDGRFYKITSDFESATYIDRAEEPYSGSADATVIVGTPLPTSTPITYTEIPCPENQP